VPPPSWSSLPTVTPLLIPYRKLRLAIANWLLVVGAVVVVAAVVVVVAPVLQVLQLVACIIIMRMRTVGHII